MTQLDLAKSDKRRALLRPSLLALTACFAASTLGAAHAQAQSVDPAQIEALQDQIKQLQAEIDGLVANQVQASKKISAISPGKGATVVTSPGKGQLKIGAVTVTLGGYLAAEGVYRSKSEGSDVTSSLAGIPFTGGAAATTGSINNGINARQSEFHLTGRQTRLSLGFKAKPNSYTNLSAYVEGDFLGVGTISNQKATNSYVPRLRQAWIGYERADLGAHVFAGQTYSLATQETVGMAPGKEAGFPLIDAAQQAGFVNVRQPGLRVFKDFDNKYFVGISLENPQLLTVGTAPVGVTTLTGNLAGPISTTSGSISATNTTTTDVAPDLIGKLAADTPFGHYELLGIGRVFHSREQAGLTATNYGHASYKTGGGVGVTGFDSVVPKVLDLQGSAIYGYGTSRYSSAQLGDATFDTGGGIVPIRSFVANVGATGHVTPTLDIYGVGGVELIGNPGSIASTNYGNGVANTGGCYNPTLTSSCSPEIKRVEEFTAGAWWSFYKGAAGTMQTGLQYSYLIDDAFQGFATGSSAGHQNGPTPHASDNIIMASFRYYPFK